MAVDPKPEVQDSRRFELGEYLLCFPLLFPLFDILLAVFILTLEGYYLVI